MLKIVEQAERVRREVSLRTAQSHKAEYGQFMTPASVARFMASLFPHSSLQTCRLLDAGAGVGALSRAFLQQWIEGGFAFKAVDVTAYEIDASLHHHLARHLGSYGKVTSRIIEDDYIAQGTGNGAADPAYTHAILNPPYKKINSGSAHRLALRRVGIETVNLYSAFVALAIRQMALGGQVVAIMPRSFCNGPYYRPFRDLVMEHTAIRHMHLFASRNKAFKDDDVLQENLIIRLERGANQGPVTITTSTDDTFSDIVTHTHPFNRIVFPDDPERFIHVPTSPEKTALEQSSAVRWSLTDIGLKVSTGPVVDFRLRKHLRPMPEIGTVPLLYPGHFTSNGATWPLVGSKKPNAILRNGESEKWLYPNGFYCVVRRFSAKEEKRRIVASVVEPEVFCNAPMLGFENHLNVFHENKGGLPKALAHGLAAFLNTTAVDDGFRRFNGHTQVNATDLKVMKYPSRQALTELGMWAMEQDSLAQSTLDTKFQALAE